jgi:hypothetical protein
MVNIAFQCSITHHIAQNEVLSESGTEVLQMQAESKYKFVHTELVQVFMILNGSAHGFLDLKINTTNNP